LKTPVVNTDKNGARIMYENNDSGLSASTPPPPIEDGGGACLIQNSAFKTFI